MRADAREALVPEPVALLGDELKVERLSRGMVAARDDMRPVCLEKRVDGIAKVQVRRLDLEGRRAGGAAELQLRGGLERDAAFAARKADEVALRAVGPVGIERAQILERLSDAEGAAVPLVGDRAAVIEHDEVLDLDPEQGGAARLLDSGRKVADESFAVLGYVASQVGCPISCSRPECSGCPGRSARSVFFNY